MPRNPPEEETAPQLLALAHGVALQSILGFVIRTYSKKKVIAGYLEMSPLQFLFAIL